MSPSGKTEKLPDGRWRTTNEYQRKYYRSEWPKRQVILKRYHCKKNGIPFDLEASDLVIPEICPVLGIPLKVSEDSGPKYNSPSIDRIRPELGYVKGNIAVISQKANQIKNNATLEELGQVYNWLKSIL